MTVTAPPPSVAPEAPPESMGRLALVQALLDAALQAQRSGTLAELVREHPLATRWLLRRHASVMRGTAGDAWPADPQALAAEPLLRWLVTQLRPDAEPHFDGIGRDAWLQLSGWRPLLAMASHAGLLPVPDFPHHYRRRSGEAALDNLCGLWGVGPSTVYRLLEKARQMMAAQLLEPRVDAQRRLSLRRLVALEVHARLALADATDRAAWHMRQATLCHAAADAASELWHRWQAGDVSGFVLALRLSAAALAHEPETDAVVERFAVLDLATRARRLVAGAGSAGTRAQPGRPRTGRL